MNQLAVRRAVYTGAFDPITLGHLNVIERGCRLVDELIVGVGINTGKKQLFSPEERAELVALATGGRPKGLDERDERICRDKEGWVLGVE